MKASNLIKSITTHNIDLSGRVILKSSDGSIGFNVENNEVDFSSTGFNTYHINQVSHELVEGDFIRVSQQNDDPEAISSYEKASATSSQMAEVIGVVTNIVDADNFSYRIMEGVYEGPGIPTSNVGSAIFLSETPGELTNQENQLIRKPVGVILEKGTKMVLFSMLGTINTTYNGQDYFEYDYIVTAGDYYELRFIVEGSAYEKIFIPNGTYQMRTSSSSQFLDLGHKKILQGESREGVIFDIDFSTCPNVTSGIKAINSNGKLSEPVQNLLIINASNAKTTI